jgi:aspartate kinase
MRFIVSKFGGTSMGNAECLRRSAEVAQQQKSNLVVVSATSGTTNLLLKIGLSAELQDWPEVEKLLSETQKKHNQIAQDLSASEQSYSLLDSLYKEMETLARGIFYLKDCSARASDALVSLGERMSSVLFVEAYKGYGKVQLFDARRALRTDDQFGKARALISDIESLAKKELLPLLNQSTVVTQGFIGSTAEGLTTTLGRGGSDYSAALFAEAVGAEVLEIWTDVAGIATTDPRICSDAKAISEISFQEASEMAVFGAKVLHPATLLPALRKNIPVFVGSSFDKNLEGTWVRQKVKELPLVRALALRKKQVLLTLSTPDMLHAHGFLFQIFKIFNDHKVSIDAITTSEISVSLTLDDSTLVNKKLIQDLSAVAEVSVEEGLSLVSLIGNQINHTPGIAQKIFAAISGINVRMICLGASKHNFCFLVSEASGEEAIRKLHKAFIS